MTIGAVVAGIAMGLAASVAIGAVALLLADRFEWNLFDIGDAP